VFERRHFLTAFAVAIAVAGLSPAMAQEKSITVFAAASLKNALDEVDSLFTKQSGIKIVASYAASSSLMKQIEQGAPADVFQPDAAQYLAFLTTPEARAVFERYGFRLLGKP